MEVYFYDVSEKLPLGNATKCETLDELLQIADVVTLHIDGRSTNKDFFGAREFGLMKKGALFLNLSRGFIIDLQALREAILSGAIGGAAVDVFPEEPKGNDHTLETPLQGLPNVILTPHIGGATEEAQENIGRFVAKRLVDFVNTGATSLSVNMPWIELRAFQDVHRFLHIHHNTPGVLANINNILADHQINVVGQYLGTKDGIGYVITDLKTEHGEDVAKALKNLHETIRFRPLY